MKSKDTKLDLFFTFLRKYIYVYVPTIIQGQKIWLEN